MSIIYYTSKSGYEQSSQGNSEFGIHQLLAIAEGEDPYKVFSGGEYNIHHKNEVPWDNRPENIELLTKAEHNSKHWNPDMLMGDYVTAELCNDIRSKYEGGATIPELVEETGRSKSAIYNHLKGACSHFNEDITPGRKGPRDGEWKDKETFEKLYCEMGMTLQEVADELGCSLSNASVWKRKHGL